MQDNCIKLSIDLPGIYVKCYEEINNIIFIRVSPIKKSLKCPKCDIIADRLHDVVDHAVRDIDILGKKVVLVIEKIRLRCAHCYHRGIPIKISFLQKYQRKIDRLMEYIVKAVLKTSVNEVAEELETAYELKEEFRDIYMIIDKNEAIHAFENWCIKVKDNRIKEYYKVIRTVRNWFDEIFNYFKVRLTNGPIEGINNKIKLIKRTGFGFASYANIKRRIIVRFQK